MELEEDRPTVRLNRDKLLALQAFVSDAAQVTEEAKEVVAAKLDFEEGRASTMQTSNRTSRTTPTRTTPPRATPPASRYSRPAEQQAWLRSSVQGLGSQRAGDGLDQTQPSAFAAQYASEPAGPSFYQSSPMAQRKTSLSGAAGSAPAGYSTAQPDAHSLNQASRALAQHLLPASEASSPSKTPREAMQGVGSSHSPPARKRTSSFTGASSSQAASPLRASLAQGTVGFSNALRQASESGNVSPIPPLIPRSPANPGTGTQQGDSKQVLRSSIIVTEDQPSIMARWAVHGTTGAAGAFGPSAATVYYPPSQQDESAGMQEDGERPSQSKGFTFSDLVYQSSGLDKRGMGFTRRGTTSPGIVTPSITETFANRTASSTSGAPAHTLPTTNVTSSSTLLPPVRQSQSSSAPMASGGDASTTATSQAAAAVDDSPAGLPAALPAGMIMNIAQYKQMEAAEQAGNLPERDSAVRSSLTGLAAAAALLRQQGNGAKGGQLDSQDGSLTAQAAAGSSTHRALAAVKKGPILSSAVSPSKSSGTGLTTLSKQMLLHTPALAGRTLVVASRHADPAESLRISTEQLKRDMRFRHPRV